MEGLGVPVLLAVRVDPVEAVRVPAVHVARPAWEAPEVEAGAVVVEADAGKQP